MLYRDDWVIALNKPAGLAVQGGTRQHRHLDAMLEALRFEAPEAPRLVHRLDRDTSGVLLLARSAPAARRLSAAFGSREARKIYWALVAGVPEQRRGYIDLPLVKRPGAQGGGERMRPDADGDAADSRSALTAYGVVDEVRLAPRGPRLAWLVLIPLTGRTHQLRAHCAALGTPIVGDGKYGGKRAFPDGLAERLGPAWGGRLMLHAREIALPHPDDGTTLRVSAPPPPHMAAAAAVLGFDEVRAERVAETLLQYADGLGHSPPGTRPSPRRRRTRTR